VRGQTNQFRLLAAAEAFAFISAADFIGNGTIARAPNEKCEHLCAALNPFLCENVHKSCTLTLADYVLEYELLAMLVSLITPFVRNVWASRKRLSIGSKM
jgi:hypothetical protein